MTTELTMQSSFLQKSLFGLWKAITDPRASLAWVVRGHLAHDPVFVSQTYWFTGSLPRIALPEMLPEAREVEVVVPRAFDRKRGTSISAEEACYVGAIAKCRNAKKALEIGTYDGNTALLLAANLALDGQVVTVDLPPDFDASERDKLAFREGEFNLTPRTELARQYQGQDGASRIRQVYGDSGKLDWGELNGPFDLVFIDGCHAEDYVRSDSRNAMKHLAPEGIIVWHDYGMITAVSKVVDEVARENPSMKIFVIEGTRLAVGIASKR